jgi:hypothetical protein
MSVEPPPPGEPVEESPEPPAEPSKWERWLVFGPDRHGSRAEMFLPWWGRWLIVLFAWVLGWFWRDLGVGQELGWFLAYSALVSMSLAASFSTGIFAINLSLAALWIALPRFWPLRRKQDAPVRWAVHQTVMFLNRQLGHIEALGVWSVLSLSLTPQLHYQLPLLALVYLMGEPLINAIARKYLLPHEEGRSAADLSSARRPLIYVATVLGLVFLGLRPMDSQITKLLPLMVAILLGGVFPRLLRHRLRAQRIAGQNSQQRAIGADFRRSHRDWTRRADVGFGPVLSLAVIAGLAGLSFYQRQAIDQRARTKLDGASPPPDRCVPEPGGPARTSARVFLVSDSQMHELGGARFPGQMELSDAFVPVALRPVELDMLSFATLDQFGRVYGALAGANPDLYWAHLGDFADLSCASELERAEAALKVLPAGRLAGIAPGNHDMSFTGNFFWGPFWTAACPGGRLEKPGSLDRIEAFARERLAAGGTLVRSGRKAPTLGFGARGGSLSMLTPLGTIEHRGKARALLAVFLDTADGGAFDLGVAGLFGTLSRGQVAAVKETVSAVVKDGRYADPIYVVFAHHPHAEMSPWSRTRLDELLGWLDSNPPRTGDSVAEPRTLALITAHTHHAESHRQCIDGHAIREIVVGATIDPPQQAALLELGPDARGRASLRLRTIHAVSRPGFTCGAEPAISAAACRRVAAVIARAPECQVLVDEPDPPGADCRALQRPQTVKEKLAAIALSRGSTAPEEIVRDQTRRAQRLLGCLCRGGRCPGFRADDDTILENARYQTLLEAMTAAAPNEAERKERETELACVSWAAAAVQAHKASGMTMREALRCAYDDETLPAAQETVATLEERPCR